MTVDVTVEIKYECWCEKCGEGLCRVTTVREEKYESGKLNIYVEPCPKCLELANDEGFARGEAHAWKEIEDERIAEANKEGC